MKKSRIEQIILGVILLLPALFLSAFAIHDALMPTMTCERACEHLQSEYVACDDDVCFCDPGDGGTPIHIMTVVEEGSRTVVECAE